jgi:SP family sugar:H+ symporter-like MFS transporter
MTESSFHPDQGNTTFIILISCIATIGGFLFGFDSGVINGTVDGLTAAFDSDAAVTGFNVASMLLGCALGAAAAGRLADKYGRRALLIAASIFFIVSAWGSGIATSSFEFVIYRVIGGMAVGAASVMAPAYISEVSLARYRGRLTTVQQIAIISGLFLSFVSNYVLADIAKGSSQELWLGFEAWRWMFWMELVPAILFFVTLLFIPESPRFLVFKDKTDAARKVLRKLYGDRDGDAKLADIQASLEQDHKPRMRDLLVKGTRRIRPIIWVGIGLATFQQFVGINVVFYYGAVLWQAVGFSESDALLINVISGGVSIGACVLALSLIDKIGRKPLLWIGSVGMTVTLAIAAAAFATATFNPETNQVALSGAMGVIALIAANAYVAFFNMSWGPIMWVMLGEMFPNQIRGSALAVAGFFQWMSNFLITLTFPILLVSIGLAGAYGLYTLCAAVSIVFVLKFVKETKGKELEEMEG